MQRKLKYHAFVAATIGMVSLSAHAVAPGFYMGLMGGPATNSGNIVQAINKNPPPATTPVTPRSKQFATRIFMGYKANQYFGVESGLTYFSTISYDNKGVATCGGLSSHVRDFDLVGKGSFTLSRFEVYGKAGAAIAYVTSSGALNPGSITPTNSCGGTQHKTEIRPTVSFGTSLDVSQNWVIEGSWNRIFVGGLPGNVDFYALGFSYHFVNIYCGQFLCDS